MVLKTSPKGKVPAKHTVKIFTTPQCPYCHKAKDFFRENGIMYEEKDVSSDQKAQDEMIKASGELGVPQIWIGDSILVGFDREQLKKALKL